MHLRPEILSDIDELLQTHLSEKWRRTHEPFEVLAKVSGQNICYFSDDEDLDEEKVMAYLVKAYNAAFNGLSEEVLLMKNGVQIPPEDILDIKPLTCW